MSNAHAEIDIAGSADETWALVGNFGGIDEWLPGIDSCRSEGDTRYIGFSGGTVTEQMLARDDGTRSITYSVVDGMPLETHKATITVTPIEDGCHVTWDVEATPDKMTEGLGRAYQSGLNVLKARIEG